MNDSQHPHRPSGAPSTTPETPAALHGSDNHTSKGASSPTAVDSSSVPEDGNSNAGRVQLNDRYRLAASISLIGLIVVCLLWEGVIAPLKPEGSWLILKALPLLLPLRGILRGRIYTYQWASMLSLLYVLEGSVRLFSDVSLASAVMGGVELTFALAFFVFAILYVRPSKLYHKQRKGQ